MKVTLKNIAKTCGVSEATASLALNDRPGVRFETRKQILEAADKMGYTPSRSAVMLSKKQSGIIGLLIPNLTNLFYSRIVQALENYLYHMGYKMIITTTDNEPAREKEMIKSFVSFGVDGVVIYPLIRDNHNPEYLDLLEKNDIPFVFLGGYYPAYKAPYCMSDFDKSFADLIELMYSGGARDLVYFGSCRYIVSNQVKIASLENHLARKSILFNPDKDYIYLKKTDFDHAYIAAKRLLQTNRHFDAVISGDAYSGFGVYQALTEAGIKVPDEVSIAHMDNLMKPSICVCRMTCIEQDIPGIVDGTVRLLMALINHEDTAKCLLIPTKLIIRNSVKSVE